jgi:hypothetical protein
MLKMIQSIRYTLFSIDFEHFLPSGDTQPGLSRNCFESRQVAACRFSQEFRANPGNVSTNRKRGKALAVLKSFWQIQKQNGDS